RGWIPGTGPGIASITRSGEPVHGPAVGGEDLSVVLLRQAGGGGAEGIVEVPVRGVGGGQEPVPADPPHGIEGGRAVPSACPVALPWAVSSPRCAGGCTRMASSSGGAPRCACAQRACPGAKTTPAANRSRPRS